MPPSVAFRFLPQSFRGTPTKLMGYQSANRSLLEAFARHGTSERLVAWALDEASYRAFDALVSPHGKPTAFVPAHRTQDLAGTLITGGSDVDEPARGRRFHDPRAFSVVGVQHTLVGTVADQVGRWFVEPLEAWDAVVCTSRTTKAAVEALLDRHQAWLERLHGAARRPSLKLPVLPLGVHADRFAPTPERLSAGAALRERLGIPREAVVALHVGRLSAIDKANPLPMFLACEAAARAHPGARLDLLVAGWAYDQPSLDAWRASAARWCPSVRVHVVDGLAPDVQDAVRAAADLFVSLVDNVQETFGLTPVEAMAAGLPCVISEWDGYRDTVRDGVDGFLIPTRTPPSGAATAIGAAFPSALQISGLQRALAQCTEVDVGAAVLAVSALVRHADLRRKLGESGRQRVAEAFDWSIVVPRYEELFAELDAIRASAPERAPRLPGEPAHPFLGDVFDVFDGYPTERLRGDDVVYAAPGAAERLAAALTDPILASGVAVVIARADLLAALVGAFGVARSVDDVLASLGADAAEAWRGILWLAKVGALVVVEREDPIPHDPPRV